MRNIVKKILFCLYWIIGFIVIVSSLIAGCSEEYSFDLALIWLVTKCMVVGIGATLEVVAFIVGGIILIRIFYED